MVDKDPGDFTRDMRILPSPKEFKIAILKDAEDYTDVIKEKLTKAVRDSKAGVVIDFELDEPVPPLYEPLVRRHLNKWANMFGYDIELHLSTVSSTTNIGDASQITSLSIYPKKSHLEMFDDSKSIWAPALPGILLVAGAVIAIAIWSSF